MLNNLLQTGAIKTASKKAFGKTTEATRDLIGNKITDEVIKASKALYNNSETHEEEIIRERFIHPELRHKITDDLRLKTENY